jgi:hypothetical protein
MLMEYINAQAIKGGGLIDVSACIMQDVIDVTPPVRIEIVDDQITTGDVTGLFFPANSTPATRIHALIVMNSAGALVGCIARPEFRY